VAANQLIMVVAMFECAEGVGRAAEIAAVPGLDMLLEGAADLSQSLGMPWQIAQPDVQQALLATWKATSAAGVAYCTIPHQP
ncbi:aldolase/citrate lyase family protein, partial [Pseudomonas syringae group genomosp. 7]|uniref:aldolase/citrate lyase family protein n=1 Tax=Pseudomonas syringae group genomosp. 7 TaxID=251699 RepID=UPI00376F7D70